MWINFLKLILFFGVIITLILSLLLIGGGVWLASIYFLLLGFGPYIILALIGILILKYIFDKKRVDFDRLVFYILILLFLGVLLFYSFGISQSLYW